jgi:Na+/phosphate symporter
MYLEENLKLTPENMSDKAVASDELKEMHQQVNICLSKLLPLLYREGENLKMKKRRRYKMVPNIEKRGRIVNSFSLSFQHILERYSSNSIPW